MEPEGGMYIDVILPLAIPRAYTYMVPESLQDGMMKGIRVEVPLRNKLYSGIVQEIHREKPLKSVRNVLSILDDAPIVQPLQFKFWSWLASYYCAHLGEVLNVALPGGLKLSSQTKVRINHDVDPAAFQLSEQEYLVAEAVSIQSELTIDVIQDILNKKTVYPVIKSLLQKGILNVVEELQQRYTVKKEDFILLDESLEDDPTQALALVERSEKQTRAVLSMYSLVKKLKHVPKKLIYELSGADSSVVNAVAKKGIWTVYQKDISRLDLEGPQPTIDLPPLSDEQARALKAINAAHHEQRVALLHGITGSGKTRLYVELIRDVISKGGQVLYLLPEIALTSQIVKRLKARLKEDMLIYHSQINENQRVEIWNAALLKNTLFIGARSALFLPFYRLKLIIVDEEHDPSYKQQSPNPRYHARDAAVMLGHLCGAKVLLGSATPSLESFANATQRKYELVQLSTRYGPAQLPDIELIDLKDSHKKGLMREGFSVHLLDRIRETISAGEQVILFQNRRGFAPVLRCKICDWKSECINCDVSLTFHQRFNELKCHYCGVRSKRPQYCPSCGSEQLQLLGLGTERIEEILPRHVEGVRIKRFDYDTTRSKKNQEKILADFNNGTTQVLVGTQMITKGFDFDNISLVGVMNADALLAFPDFRASERSFQLLMQVGGRAGRREKKGTVVIQTYSPAHPVLTEVIKADYASFYNRELAERKQFMYPPYFHRIALWFSHKELTRTREAATEAARALAKAYGGRVVGPVDPPILRLRNKYHQVIYIRIEKKGGMANAVKKSILDVRAHLRQTDPYKSVVFTIDVDPG